MKKLWTKFKRWLIVKLGGYLEGPKGYEVKHIYGTSTTVRPICVCAVHKISGGHMRYASLQVIFDSLFEGLRDEIRKNEDLFSIDHSWDPITDEVIYRIVIKLIPNDWDLSKIEDNTRINGLISHELMTVNKKLRPTYNNRSKCFLSVDTNKPVKTTDATKSKNEMI